MSVKVLREVFAYSRATKAPWSTLIAIADTASDEGVAYPALLDRCRKCWSATLEWDEHACPGCGQVADPRRRTSLTFKARLGESTVRTALGWLEENGEIERRKAQRGRRRISVYRVILGHLIELEVDYDDLPFKLSAPFSRPLDSDGREGVDQWGDDRQNLGRRPSDPGVDDRQNPEVPIEKGPISRDPSGDPPAAEPLLRETVLALPEAESVSASAAALVGQGPASLEQVIAVLGRFAGVDLRSLRVVEPYAWQLPAEVFFEVADEAKRRRNRRNEVGLFVHLLKIACAERRLAERAEAQAAAAARDAEHAESFLRRLLAVPNEAEPEITAGFIARYAADGEERARLAELEAQLRAEPAEAKLRRSIVDTARLYVPAAGQELHDFIDEWVEERGFDWTLRAELHDLAEQELDKALAQLPGWHRGEEAAA